MDIWTTGRTDRLFRVVFSATAMLGLLSLASCGSGSDEPGADGSDSLASRLEGETMSAATGHEHHDHGLADGTMAAAELSGLSLYNLDSEWWGPDGVRRPLGALQGRVQVLSMVYTNCAFACPRILAEMKRIESALGEAGRDHVGFVLVSIDPERDTPERLAEFSRDLRLDPDRWTLLASEERNILELAAILGVRYMRESATDFAHTNLIAILDSGGEVVHRQLGLGEGFDETIRIIGQLVEATPHSHPSE